MNQSNDNKLKKKRKVYRYYLARNAKQKQNLSPKAVQKERNLRLKKDKGRVSQFDQGRIVAYRNCGLSFSQRVGRSQANLMRIYHPWIQEETMDRLYPPRCTTDLNDKCFGCRTVVDRVASSQTIAQQIQSVTHLSVYARTIGRSLQQSPQGATASFTLDWKPQVFALSMV
ncbi:HTH_Tnp_Tc3_2 domain-containing protein [Trichonephila clavipes]|nr:HTH_Tnp_Tc3_2 domain-containing protein [Trichonephila clavipes]